MLHTAGQQKQVIIVCVCVSFARSFCFAGPVVPKIRSGFDGDGHIAIETLNECRTRSANVTTTIRVFVCGLLGLVDVRAGRVQLSFKFSMAKVTSPSKT